MSPAEIRYYVNQRRAWASYDAEIIARSRELVVRSRQLLERTTPSNFLGESHYPAPPCQDQAEAVWFRSKAEPTVNATIASWTG